VVLILHDICNAKVLGSTPSMVSLFLPFWSTWTDGYGVLGVVALPLFIFALQKMSRGICVSLHVAARFAFFANVALTEVTPDQGVTFKMSSLRVVPGIIFLARQKQRELKHVNLR
jgi:hypothetical protein